MRDSGVSNNFLASMQFQTEEIYFLFPIGPDFGVFGSFPTAPVNVINSAGHERMRAMRTYGLAFWVEAAHNRGPAT